MQIAALQSWAWLIVLPDIEFSWMAIGVDAKRYTKWRTQQSRVLRAHGPTPGSKGLWERVTPKIVYTEETSHNDAAWMQKAITAIMLTMKKYKGGGTPIPIPINTIAVAFIKIQPSCHQSISFSLPREVTQRQCQHTAEINITNISHKQAQKRFFRGSFQVKWVDEENESLTEEEGEGRGFSEQVALKLYLHVQVFTFPLWCACQALHSSERTYVIAIVCLHCGIGLHF